MKGNRRALYSLAYQLSQAKLESQANSAIGADARSMSFAGLCFTASALLVGFSKESFVPWAMITGAFLLILAATLAGYAARPISFRFPGANFSDLKEDVQQNRDIEEVISELGNYSEKHIAENNATLKKNSELLVKSYYLSIFAMFVAVVPQAVRLITA